jgi:mannosyltransferase OCH1-like enzyme
MIPRILHFIWIGEKKRPDYWMSWMVKNPEFEIVFWDERMINHLRLKNVKLYDEYYSKGEYHGAADVARVEILEKHGGIYMDSDSICIKPINDADFMESEFFAAFEGENHPGRIANGAIGSVPGHPILKDYIESMGKAIKIRPVWNTIGGTMFTKCINDFIEQDFIDRFGDESDVRILPTCTFYPVNHNGQKAPIVGDVYADQLWGSTKKLYK